MRTYHDDDMHCIQIVTIPSEKVLIRIQMRYNHCYDFLFDWLQCIPIGYLLTYPCCSNESYIHSTVRMSISFVELVVIIIFGILYSYDENEVNYLFSLNNSLIVFIFSLVSFVICIHFPFLMPNLSLPLDVGVRSIHGLAHLGAISELERKKQAYIKLLATKQAQINRFDGNQSSHYYSMVPVSKFFDQPHSITLHSELYLYLIRGIRDTKFCQLVAQICLWKENWDLTALRFTVPMDQIINKVREHVIAKEKETGDKWMDTATFDRFKKAILKLKGGRSDGMPGSSAFHFDICTIFALANRQYDTVTWPEAQGSTNYKLLLNNISHSPSDIDSMTRWAQSWLKESGNGRNKRDMENYTW